MSSAAAAGAAVLMLVSVVLVSAARGKYAVDERWVCAVKTSCAECLQLAHCSWCGTRTRNKCFSNKLPHTSDTDHYCNNDTIHHVDYGLSFVENAECSCARGNMALRCYPPGVAEGPECSARGDCVCGHCVCFPTPDEAYPTKIVMGEYCEFDNFSCSGAKCNEGPYSLSEPKPDGEDISEEADYNDGVV